MNQIAPKKLGRDERLDAYQKKLRTLKDRSALREVVERELLLEFININHGNISEYPMLEAQQKTVVELLCGRAGHAGYEYIHKHVGRFIVLLAHYEKAVKTGDEAATADHQANLLNTEGLLIKCVQGIVYAMALITDNFEEMVLRHFGQGALKEYSALIEKHELDHRFWTGLVEQFIAKRVDEAHAEILANAKFDISKEKNFLVIRFLFDDILAKLNPTSQKIDKTRIQKGYVHSRTDEQGKAMAKLTHGLLAKNFSSLGETGEVSNKEILQASRIACIDTATQEFFTRYQEKVALAKTPDTDKRDTEQKKQDQMQFKFLLDQVVATGTGASIAIGMTSDHFFRALGDFVPDQIEAMRALAKDFSIPTLEKILFFLLENHYMHMLREIGRDEGGKVQVRSGRARRVPEAAVDELPHMSKIRKKQLWAKDPTREGMLLFKPKTAKQLASSMDMLSLEPELVERIRSFWTKCLYRVDIMVLVNLELVARTSTNLKNRLAEILRKYGVAPAASEEEI
ncbi:hypothetical protein [Pseudodesulfovibrio tunisiensis]|uniref:hypothetical protein n=1 Tax=Pseudodesulfovibrio tunisiensis TaxID=463192 RepID=UPI001FB31BC1|nr:hypothetical protein [Pseudodesulfovibrio tunisiensis]